MFLFTLYRLVTSRAERSCSRLYRGLSTQVAPRSGVLLNSTKVRRIFQLNVCGKT